MYIYAIIDSINHQAKSLLKSKITFFSLKFETWCIKSLHLLRVKQSSGSRCHKVMANLCINWLLNLQRTCNALYLLLKSWLLNLQFTSGLYCIPIKKIEGSVLRFASYLFDLAYHRTRWSWGSHFTTKTLWTFTLSEILVTWVSRSVATILLCCSPVINRPRLHIELDMKLETKTICLRKNYIKYLY